ncbi:hypothetical protein JAAARDRAFT_189495 [Jaapia argillacea MUCL 33604]|uniref:F-box domain-containing protein n=1 Tax=Jaapia argillacea MUCL 33604 TaxID=933084 RepID=A0A067Q7G3_9AGAM|nr:hypothetical protein JAAARDRAFT_189495 [Jaapia argillacea MUCL 33604]
MTQRDVVGAIPRRTLEDCPAEICELIFTYACVDDGSLGRSLSLVSRYIKDVSRTTRYQSVSISGLDEMLSLNTILEGSPPEYRKVRNLFIQIRFPRKQTVKPAKKSGMVVRFFRRKFFARRGDPPTSAVPPAGPPEDAGDPTSQTASSDGLCLAMQTFCAVEILSQVASTLRTLTVVMPYSRKYPLAPVPLPHLTELTLYGSCGTHAFWDFANAHSLPSLQRLHLAGGYGSSAQIAECLQFAPSLTHLRFTSPEPGDALSSCAQGVLLFANRSARPQDQDTPAPQLTRVVIQPMCTPSFISQYSEGLTAFSIAMEMMGGGIDGISVPFLRNGVILSPQLWHGHTDSLAITAKGYWLSRNDGGLGCWDEVDRVV